MAGTHCLTCKHWKRDETGAKWYKPCAQYQRQNDTDETEDGDNRPRNPNPFLIVLYTAANFGCVQYEPEGR